MANLSATKASITLPASLSNRLRKLAKREHRTLSGVIQEAARYYLLLREWEDMQRTMSIKGSLMGLKSEEDVVALIEES